MRVTATVASDLQIRHLWDKIYLPVQHLTGECYTHHRTNADLSCQETFHLPYHKCQIQTKTGNNLSSLSCPPSWAAHMNPVRGLAMSGCLDNSPFGSSFWPNKNHFLSPQQMLEPAESSKASLQRSVTLNNLNRCPALVENTCCSVTINTPGV